MIIVYIVLAILIVLAASALLFANKTLSKAIVRQKDRKSMPEINVLLSDPEWAQNEKIIEEKTAWFLSQDPETHTIRSFDNLKLSARFLQSEVPSHKAVVVVHGYRGDGLRHFSGISQFYHNNGYNILMLDNRAHGSSEGKYVGFGVLDRKDVLQWLKYYLKEIDPQAELYLHGISMGGAAVLMAAGESLPAQVKAVIDDCGFISAWEMFEHIAKGRGVSNPDPMLYIMNILCKMRAGYYLNEISTIDCVQRMTVPALFIHGEKDQFVPTEMGKRNYVACRTRKELLLVADAGHTECYYKAPVLYEHKVLSFLDSVM